MRKSPKSPYIARPWVLMGMVWVLLAGAALLALTHLRHDALDGEARGLRLLSLALTEEIDRGFEGTEEGLRAMRVELKEGRVHLTGEDARRELEIRAGLMPFVRTLWLVSANGQTLSASDNTGAPALSSFAPSLDTLEVDGIAVSRPFQDSASQEWLVALATRYADPPADSAGLIFAAVPAKSLLGAFSAAVTVDDERMAVFRRDGVLLSGGIVDAPSLDEGTVAQRLANADGTFIRHFGNGAQRMLSRSTLPRYGIKVVLSRDIAAILSPWREWAVMTALGMLVLISMTATGLYLILRADRRRTEAQRALEAQRLRATKLESIGMLAGGVAHDFNNVLGAIVGFSEMAQGAAVPGSAQARHLDMVVQAGIRGKELVERILAFSRGGTHESTIFALEPIVEEVLSMLEASLRPNISLVRQIGAAGSRVRGNPTQAFEATMNLCTNAVQAMPDGGVLTIRLTRLSVARSTMLSHTKLGVGDYVVLSVSDTGTGIDPEVMDRLFEPFFTTHGKSTGTGMGLAVVHGVVAAMGGAVDVHAERGRGAEFTLYFPATENYVSASDRPKAADLPRGKGQTLLIVDDEFALVALAEEMLRELGYQPFGFENPLAALQAFKDNPQRFAAVITDEVMPGLTGTQLTEWVRPLAPHVPVLLVSGFGGALLVSRAAAAGVTRVLAKPLQRADLANALDELLN